LAHEPVADTGRGLALLWWSRRDGAAHSRNPWRLRAEEDSDSCFCGQCPVSRSDSARLQPGHRFPANVSSPGMAKSHFEQAPIPTVLGARNSHGRAVRGQHQCGSIRSK